MMPKSLIEHPGKINNCVGNCETSLDFKVTCLYQFETFSTDSVYILFGFYKGAHDQP